MLRSPPWPKFYWLIKSIVSISKYTPIGINLIFVLADMEYVQKFAEPDFRLQKFAEQVRKM